MMSSLKFDTQGVICVKCKTNLSVDQKESDAQCGSCLQAYPLVHGIPVLIDEDKSIFTFEDFLSQKNLFFDISKKGKVIGLVSKLMPRMGGNNLGKKNFKALEQLLLHRKAALAPRVLVIGGSIVGEGMEDFVNSAKLSIIEGDVSFGPRTKIIFDAHSIPFANETFDAVVVQAVLEHVTNPIQCVEEIKRVLKHGGLVYAETPFMQQVHGGPYDFTRYTRSGHRKLFQDFKEVRSGATAGSATALAWSYEYFLLALFGYGKTLRLMVKFFARLTGFWIKYLDYVTGLNKHDHDGASGFYFLGEKSSNRFEDKALIAYYFHNRTL